MLIHDISSASNNFIRIHPFLIMTSFNFSVPPTKPDSLSIVGTFEPFTERDNATFICKGNVGKPPGKFIWRKRRGQDNFPVLYTNTKTNYTKLDESCSYEGMSALTIALTDKDNQAIISCAEESLMSNDAMFKYTLPIDIFCKYLIFNCRECFFWHIAQQCNS